jgi:hypothetical protein
MNVPGGAELLLLIIFLSIPAAILAAIFFGVRAATRKGRR